MNVVFTCIPHAFECCLRAPSKHVGGGGVEVSIANDIALPCGDGLPIECRGLPGNTHPPLFQDRLVNDAKHWLAAVQQSNERPKQRLACKEQTSRQEREMGGSTKVPACPQQIYDELSQ